MDRNIFELEEMDIAQTMNPFNLCSPAQIYAVFSFLAIISMIVMKQYSGVVGKAVFAIVWTILLNWLCSMGYTGLSWFLLLLPILLIVGALVIMFFTLTRKSSEKKESFLLNVD